MEEKRSNPFKSNINLLGKAYAFLIICYATWSFVYGYLFSNSYRQTLNLDKLSLPLNDIQTQINVGLYILIEYMPLVFLSFLSPLIIALLRLIIYVKKIEISLNKISSIVWSFIFQIAFCLIYLSPLLLIPIISGPIDKGKEEASKMLDDFPHDQLVLKKHGKDSIICCKVVYFTNDYAVFVKDSVTHAMTIPNGSFVFTDL